MFGDVPFVSLSLKTKGPAQEVYLQVHLNCWAAGILHEFFILWTATNLKTKQKKPQYSEWGN